MRPEFFTAVQSIVAWNEETSIPSGRAKSRRDSSPSMSDVFREVFRVAGIYRMLGSSDDKSVNSESFCCTGAALNNCDFIGADGTAGSGKTVAKCCAIAEKSLVVTM